MFYLLGSMLFLVIVTGCMWLAGRFNNFILYGSSSPDRSSTGNGQSRIKTFNASLFFQSAGIVF